MTWMQPRPHRCPAGYFYPDYIVIGPAAGRARARAGGGVPLQVAVLLVAAVGVQCPVTVTAYP